jgi:polyketide biosynthesis enoyl-CoA hydratase PksI
MSAQDSRASAAMTSTPIVSVSQASPGVALLRMSDSDGHNMFTPALRAQVSGALATLAERGEARVVVVAGTEQHFCAGGTQSELLDMIDGKMTFETDPFYRALMDCPLPIVSAMAGHAFGAGLLFGLYADVIVMAEESTYSANFMSYGFTPGAGATAVLPAKLGHALAAEMLFTGGLYRGGELRQRGAGMKIIERGEVEAEACYLASTIAAKPLVSLKLLKAALRRELSERVRAAVATELDMHRVSFALPEVRDRVARGFGRW